MARAIERIIKSTPLSAMVSVPGSEKPAEGWPLLCFLHGYDEAQPIDITTGVTRHGPLRRENRALTAEQFIIVAPQLPLAGDLWIRYVGAVRDIVEQVEREHGSEGTAKYLTGFSFGGNGVFDLALEQPDLWRALWPVDPTRVPPTDPGLPVWLSLGQISRRLRDRYVERLELEPAGLEPSGARLYFDQAQDHVGSARLAYADERIFEWLRQW